MQRRKFIASLGTLLPVVALGGRVSLQSVRSATEYEIRQFKDSGLAHFSYAIRVGNKIILIDPARDPEPYYKYAVEAEATITGVIETHPHADFASSHLEIHKKTGAVIHASKLLKAQYPHQPFDEGQTIPLSVKVSLRALNTPGHSPDSISVVLREGNKDIAVFSGDALLFNDVGRPDLRDYSGDYATQKRTLAIQMYHTVRNKYAPLADDVVVYPAHGAGSLCGKSIRNVDQSTIGYERQHNYAFKPLTEQEFVELLLNDQPFIPHYFAFSVEANKVGFPTLAGSVKAVSRLSANFQPAGYTLVIDTRKAEIFRQSHRKGAINIPDGSKFETWLGSLVKPEQPFFLVAEKDDSLGPLITKTAKIGYERFVKGAYAYNDAQGVKSEELDVAAFKANPGKYTVVDVRTEKEAKEQPFFSHAINIPIADLEKRLKELPSDKPVVIHCASGYRSAIGASLLSNRLPGVMVFDLGPDISQWDK